MERIVEIMLKERIIDREALLQVRHNLIGITKEQTLLILNVMSIVKNDGNQLTVSKIANSFNWEKKEVESILTELMENKVVNIKMREGKYLFNFDILWQRLIKTYLTPKLSANVEEVLEWTSRMLLIPSSPALRKQISEWVKDGGTKRIISVIEMIFRLNKESRVNLMMLRDLYSADASDKKINEKKLKNIAKFDWLSK